MSGNKIVLDTNVILYLLNGNQELAQILNGMELYVSVITEIELLGYQDITTNEKNKIQLFLADCKIVPLQAEIKDKCIEFKQQFKIKTPDAIVAATSVSAKVPLFTADKGFEKILNLNCIIYTP